MCPEIPTATQVLLNHTVVALAFVWVTVIITACGVGFYYLVFLKCEINSQIGIGRAAAFIYPEPGNEGGEENSWTSLAAVRLTVLEFKAKGTTVRHPNPPGLRLISRLSK